MVLHTWKALAVATILAAGALTVLAGPASAEPIVEIMVLGETHGTKSMTRSLVGIAQSKGATGCVCPGDFIYGDSAATPSGWRSMMSPFMGNMMPAQGNHDWPWTDWSGMFPDGKHYYDKDVGGVHFIALNTEYSLASGSSQRSWLESNLAERDPTALKVVFMHRPWWLPDGARHESAEFESKNGASASTMSALMEKHGVDLVVSAHEKNYQHSLVNGVHYLVAGGGGPTFYPMGYELPGAQKRLLANAVSTLEISASSMTIKSYDLNANKIEEFTMGGAASSQPTTSATTTSSEIAFEPSGGNEWWVEVDVDGPVGAVDARDTNGAWVPLAKKSWGDWAASFRVEPGHDVQYRATRTDGSVVESCWYDHPTGGCTSTATTSAPTSTTTSTPTTTTTTTTPTSTFTAKGGNEWWVQVDVDGSPASVDARDTNGAWVALAKKSWGDWAGSFRVESGHDVQYRATLGDGSIVESCWYDHPATSCATATTSTTTAPTSSGFVATFRNVRGNEWWVETEVAATGATLASVRAKVDDGAWVALEKKSWGSWAKSTHAPLGSQVTFQAVATDGQISTSAPYTWAP